MSALFDFRSFLTVMLLSVCTCTYVKLRAPQARARRVRFQLALSLACSAQLGSQSSQHAQSGRGFLCCVAPRLTRAPAASVPAPAA